MATVAGCLVVRGKTVYVTPQYHGSFKLKLSKAKEYFVGIDQSSTCSGIAVMSSDGEIVVALDVKRDNDSRDVFYNNLRMVLGEIVKDQKIKIIVREQPVPSHQYANRILEELAGCVDTWVREIPELRGAMYGKIFPATWKKYIVSRERAEADGVTFKKRCKSKACVSYDVASIFTGTMEYRDKHFSKDYDAFDALGILLGYLKYSHDSEGNLRIHGLKETRHTSVVLYKYVEASKLKCPADVCVELGANNGFIEPKVLVFNTDYNKYDNIRMASSNWDCVATILPNKYLTELQWQFDFELDKNKVMLMFVIRKDHINKSVLEYTKGELPWNEEIK